MPNLTINNPKIDKETYMKFKVSISLLHFYINVKCKQTSKLLLVESFYDIYKVVNPKRASLEVKTLETYMKIKLNVIYYVSVDFQRSWSDGLGIQRFTNNHSLIYFIRIRDK